MKNIIAAAKKSKKNKKQLAIKNLLDKTTKAEVAKVLSIIDLNNKYNWEINNAHIDVARN